MGARVFVCVPKTGYVGVGKVVGEPRRFDDAVVTVEGQAQRLAELALDGTYAHGADGAPEDDEQAEWVVPVAWERTLPVSQAIWKRGMFANQNSACKLRNAFTLKVLYEVIRRAIDSGKVVALGGFRMPLPLRELAVD